MLTEQDKEAIDACVIRPNSVWEGIKSIITAEKYTWYLETLGEGDIKPEVAKIKKKWDAMGDDKRKEYMSSLSTTTQAVQIGFKQFWTNIGIQPFQKGKKYLHQMSGDKGLSALFVTYDSLKSVKEQFYTPQDEDKPKSKGVPLTIDLWSLSADNKDLTSKLEDLLHIIPSEGILLSYNGEYIELKPEEQFIPHTDTEESSLECFEKGILFKEGNGNIFFEQSDFVKKTKTLAIKGIEFEDETVTLSIKQGEQPHVFRYADQSALVDKINRINHVQLRFSARFYDGGYDSDLVTVLQQVATILGGGDELKVGTKIKIWRKAETMQRQTAFKAAIAFRFTIEETRKLLFTVLEDDEQVDFNPRLPDEMIYAYAIINGIPMNGVNNKDNVEETPQTSVQAMLYEAKLHFLEILFGGENASYFPELIEKTDGYFNILDSANMTKTALFLAAIITSSDLEVLLRNAAEETKENSSQSEEETSQTERRPKLLPDISVMQRCYEYVSYDYEDIFCAERVAEPVFKDAQISKNSYIDVLKYVISLLITAQKQVDPKSNGSARRIAIYSDMKEYIDHCIEYVQKQPENSLLSAIDFLPLLGESELGQYLQSEFTAMIDTIIVKKIVDEWEMHRNENSRTTSYHGVEAKVGRGQVDYFRFFFNALKVAFRDLRAVTARECRDLWPAFVKMNRILAYPYFSDAGVGMKVWKHDEDVIANSRLYTLTIDILSQYILPDAEDTPNPSEFIMDLLSYDYCLEYFNRTIISHGKEKYVAILDDKGVLVSRSCNTQSGHTPLFILQEDETFTQDDDLRYFYHYRRFREQYYAKTKAYSRSDILKLAFWSFLGRTRKKKYNPELGPDEFITYFDDDVAPDTCCAAINESNSLDRFLLLCLEHEEPVLFLKEAIAYQKALPKKESKNFWKMLR